MRYIILAGLIFVGVIAWRIGESLSSDALGMAVGILFGMSAGIPAALLVLVSGRREDPDDDDEVERAFNAGRRQGLLEASNALARPLEGSHVEGVWIVGSETNRQLTKRGGTHVR